FDSPQCPDEVGAFELIARGNAARRDGKRAEAIANYEEARWRDPTLPSGLVFGLRSRIAEGLFVEARAQIRAGKFKDGLSSLKEAERMDQTLVPRPGAESLALSLARQAEIETNHAYAAFFHLRGTLQAKRGDIEDATRSLVEAVKYNPDLLERSPEAEARWIRADVKLNEGRRALDQERIEAAVTSLNEARRLDPGIVPADLWNDLCWDASVRGEARRVVDDACEEAVRLDPRNWDFRDSRGLARALVDRLEGAIEDFQAFVASDQREEEKAQRRGWIE